MYEDKKIENRNNSDTPQFSDTMHWQVFPLSYTRSTKTICLKLRAYSFT